jgi:ABC-type multidrug transport system fused ATPase/permease subunit
MRADVEAKLGRMPLSYFDSTPTGELLSRVTNDIDNIAQSLQQTMSQLLTSLLTVIGVIAMMIYVSPVLATVALDNGAGFRPHHDDHRQALSAPVRRPVVDYWQAQRSHRGGLHRP